MCVAKNKKDVKMNTIQNYGSINFNENYNKQYTNFKSSRNLKPLSKKISSTL